MDPADASVWSGVPAGLMQGLRDLGVFAGYYDGTPWHPVSRAVHRARTAANRAGGTWMLRPEMRALVATNNAVRRLHRLDGVDAWVQPLGAFGRPVRGRVAAIVESTPAQLAALHPRWSRSFWRELDNDLLRSLARQQLRLLRHAAACCAVTTWAARSLVEDHDLDPRRVHVIGYGRTIEVDAGIRTWWPPRFLFVGRDWERKNGAGVVRAFRRLRREVPEASLDIVGASPLVDEAGIRVHGSLSLAVPNERARLHHLFEQATCLVVPSHVEPFGIAYVEAGVAGMPSIGTIVGGAADAIGDGGVLVEPDDDFALLDAMRELSEPAVAEKLGALARAHAAQFTWRRSAERIVHALGLAPSA